MGSLSMPGMAAAGTDLRRCCSHSPRFAQLAGPPRQRDTRPRPEPDVPPTCRPPALAIGSAAQLPGLLLVSGPFCLPTQRGSRSRLGGRLTGGGLWFGLLSRAMSGGSCASRLGAGAYLRGGALRDCRHRRHRRRRVLSGWGRPSRSWCGSSLG